MKQLSAILLLAVLYSNAVFSQQLTVVKNGKPRGVIIIPENPAPIESKAASVLQNYLAQMSGAKLEIRSDKSPTTGAEILIGNVDRAEAKSAATGGLGEDGFILRTAGDKLVIAGEADKGILYAVNTLVEKYLGYKRFSSKVSYIPKHRSISFGTINDTERPSFTYRRILYRDANAGDFADWTRVDDISKWGAWVHTFDRLLSPREYGTTHPEYFAFYDGERHPVPARSQLCLSNPDVLEIVCKNLTAMIEKNPAAKYWSVSQNDNVNYCRCPDCSKLDAQYAAPSVAGEIYATGNTKYLSTGSGSMIWFINKVAARFPDKIISTLAYQHTRRPPVGIIPASNVNIMLCSIESTRDVPMSVGDKPFMSDLAGWGKLTNNILIWDYVIQFRNLMAPFPNLRTLQPNIQSLKNSGVTALFEQGNAQSGGDNAELKGYMITKLMWNSELNATDIMNEFIDGYYGKAANIIRDYINLTHDKVEETKSRLQIFGNFSQAKNTFMSDSLIKVYNAMFDKAEKKVRKSPAVLERVKSARLPVYYAMLEIAKSEKTGPRGAFITNDKGEQVPNPKIVDILNKFSSHSIATGVSRLTEYSVTPQQYLDAYNDFLAGRPAKPIPRL